MTDELLSDPTPPKKGAEPETTLTEETLEAVRDVSPELDAKTFDFGAFVAGMRPRRRAVTLYARGDLLAERDLLETRIREADGAGLSAKEKAGLRKQLKEVTEELVAGSIDVIVEGRASEWSQRLDKALREDGVDSAVVRTSHIMAQQIVQPEGVTAETLEQIRAVSEPQWVQLTMAATDANASSGVTPDFSRGRSGTSRR